jgi:hypothetical protein
MELMLVTTGYRSRAFAVEPSKYVRLVADVGECEPDPMVWLSDGAVLQLEVDVAR